MGEERPDSLRTGKPPLRPEFAETRDRPVEPEVEWDCREAEFDHVESFDLGVRSFDQPTLGCPYTTAADGVSFQRA